MTRKQLTRVGPLQVLDAEIRMRRITALGAPKSVFLVSTITHYESRARNADAA